MEANHFESFPKVSLLRASEDMYRLSSVNVPYEEIKLFKKIYFLGPVVWLPK